MSCARFRAKSGLRAHSSATHALSDGVFRASPSPSPPLPAPPRLSGTNDPRNNHHASKNGRPPALPETSRTPPPRPAAATPPPEGKRVSSPPRRPRQHRQGPPTPRRREGSRSSGSSRLRGRKQPARLVVSLCLPGAAPARLSLSRRQRFVICGGGRAAGFSAAEVAGRQPAPTCDDLRLLKSTPCHSNLRATGKFQA